jgi:hypothetical protein
MSDLLVVLSTVERELVAALERRPDTRVLAMLRFAAIADRGRVILALSGGPRPESLRDLEPAHRAKMADALERAAHGLRGTKPADAIAVELRAGAWDGARTGDERLALLDAARILEGDRPV